METLSGPRVTLRGFTVDDLADVHAYASNPLVWQFVEWGPSSLEDTRAFLAESVAVDVDATDRTFRWAITVSGSSRVIGSVELTVTHETNRRGSLGYILAPEHWGHGYATEAARLVVAFGFEVLDLHRIEATCDPRNAASVRVLEKAGLQLEGTMRGHRRLRGEWGDSLLFAVVAL